MKFDPLHAQCVYHSSSPLSDLPHLDSGDEPLEVLYNTISILMISGQGRQGCRFCESLCWGP